MRSMRAGGRGAWADATLGLGLMLAACGGGAGEGAPPLVGESTATAAVPASASAPAPETAPETVSAPETASETASAPVVMKAPIPTAMIADLQALGLDAKNLPPIDRLDPRTLRGVMKLMARSLGIRCSDCHTEGDFSAPTRRKKIAARMWDEFAAKLTMADGSPVFCDSCHQGRVVQLDRSNKKALGQWMQASFVDGMKRKDGQEEECESCHVDWDMKFLAKWGQ